jgi:hypothetical protein
MGYFDHVVKVLLRPLDRSSGTAHNKSIRAEECRTGTTAETKRQLINWHETCLSKDKVRRLEQLQSQRALFENREMWHFLEENATEQPWLQCKAIMKLPQRALSSCIRAFEAEHKV